VQINGVTATDRQAHDTVSQVPTVVQALIACRWLTPAQASDPALQVTSLDRSHVVTRIIAPDGRAVVVKHPSGGAASVGRDLRRELFVYRLGSWIPALGEILPRPLLIDETRQMLVLPMVTHATLGAWPPAMESTAISHPNVAARLAAAMARWHVATAEVTMWPSLAEGVLFLPDNLEEAAAVRSPSGQAFMRALVADELSANSLREARATYRHQCLVHGDIRPDNWFISSDDDRADLTIIDWEMAGSGDPAWDIASVIAEAVLERIRRGDFSQGGHDGWPAQIDRVVVPLLRAYEAAGGAIAEWDTIALFTAARLMHVASEWAEHSIDVDQSGASIVLGRARQLLVQRSDAAAALEAWGHA
jgi:Ser/Thr protein kinase RdoA (MazF antagonist)